MERMGKRKAAGTAPDDLAVTMPLTAPSDRIVREPSPLARSVLGPLFDRQDDLEHRLDALEQRMAHRPDSATNFSS